MPTPQEDQLIRLCHRREVLARAQALYHTLRTKTGPGTGYDLGQGAPGLPAICAFLASEALNFPDITYNLGQIASCLSPKVWSAAIHTARGALASNLSALPSVKRGRPAIMYRTLITQNKIGRVQRVMHWMDDAQQLLQDSPAFNREFKLEPECMEVKITVFLWVCRILKLKHVDPDAIIKERKVTQKVFNGLTRVLDDCCGRLQLRINSTVAALRENALGSAGKRKSISDASDPQSASASSSKTPSHVDPIVSATGSPSKPAARTSISAPPAKPPPNPPANPLKRKVTFRPLSEVLQAAKAAASRKEEEEEIVEEEEEDEEVDQLDEQGEEDQLNDQPMDEVYDQPEVDQLNTQVEDEVASEHPAKRQKLSEGPAKKQKPSESSAKKQKPSESPAKRQKPSDTPRLPMSNHTYTYPMPLPPREIVASSSKVTLDGTKSKPAALMAGRVLRASSPPMHSLLDDGLSSSHSPASILGPSTPRRAQKYDVSAHVHRTPQSSRRTPASAALLSDDDDMSDDEEDEEDTYPTMRRFRPVLVDCKQWGQRAPKLEKQHAVAERSKRAMAAKWGHPFDWMKRADDVSYECRGDM
ncbi:hypothetical protein EVG20_g388 [Dentipellis fragilis]|uniref:Uncharacterized protein n=1 Tax=Dentipellis fragilis TaxID=205917 RepID=A0A4Y9ZCR4_9AGAM|nr:hypothetical protein EVG20_g388 [Dentipellis fragilis]